MWKSLTLITVLSMSLNQVHARVYKHTDEQGNVTFSDIPAQDPTENAQDITAETAPKTSRPDATSNPAGAQGPMGDTGAPPNQGPHPASIPASEANNDVKMEQESKQHPPTTAPVPVPDLSVPVMPPIPSFKTPSPSNQEALDRDKTINARPTSSSAAGIKPADNAPDYQVSILSPTEGQVFTQADSSINVELHTVPFLRNGDGFKIILDGQALPDVISINTTTLPWIARGEHSLSLDLVRGTNSQSTLYEPPVRHFVQLRPSALIKPS